jgi:hypothetical protein
MCIWSRGRIRVSGRLWAAITGVVSAGVVAVVVGSSSPTSSSTDGPRDRAAAERWGRSAAGRESAFDRSVLPRPRLEDLGDQENGEDGEDDTPTAEGDVSPPRLRLSAIDLGDSLDPHPDWAILPRDADQQLCLDGDDDALGWPTAPRGLDGTLGYEIYDDGFVWERDAWLALSVQRDWLEAVFGGVWAAECESPRTDELGMAMGAVGSVVVTLPVRFFRLRDSSLALGVDATARTEPVASFRPQGGIDEVEVIVWVGATF